METHQKKLDIISCYSSSPTHHPLDASFPILILLTMEALPNSPPTMEGLIPTGAPTDDMDGTLALPTPHATSLTAEGVFLSKNQSFRCIVVLSVGLKNNEGADLISISHRS